MKEKPAELSSTFKHIVRIANVDLPGNKPIRIALSAIKGVGVTLADAACSIAKVARDHKTGNLTSEEVEKINAIISNPSQYGVPAWMLNHRKDFETGEDKHYLSGNLHFVQENDLKRLKKIRSLRGIRHIRGLPVRGQRTRSNFRKGKGKVVGVAKKKEAAPAKAPAPAGKKEK